MCSLNEINGALTCTELCARLITVFEHALLLHGCVNRVYHNIVYATVTVTVYCAIYIMHTNVICIIMETAIIIHWLVTARLQMKFTILNLNLAMQEKCIHCQVHAPLTVLQSSDDQCQSHTGLDSHQVTEGEMSAIIILFQS